MKLLKYLFVSFCFVGLLSCGGEVAPAETNTTIEEPDNSRIVSFKGRSIDLTPYVEGFPYSGFSPYYAAGKLYYMKRGATTDLLELDLNGDPDLTKGKKISDIDYSTRNVWGIRYNRNDNHLRGVRMVIETVSLVGVLSFVSILRTLNKYGNGAG